MEEVIGLGLGTQLHTPHTPSLVPLRGCLDFYCSGMMAFKICPDEPALRNSSKSDQSVVGVSLLIKGCCSPLVKYSRSIVDEIGLSFL